jgi:predicted lipid-binding transport protein (Tim44 family)
MKIAKPMLLVITPIGVGFGIYEGFRLAGGLAFLMIALISVIGAATATVVATIRREKAEQQARDAAAASGSQVERPQERNGP